MRRLFAALAVAGTVSLSAVVPSASAQGIGFNPPGFGFGNPIGTGGLGGLGVTGFGGIGGIGGGLGCGFVAQNGIGANNTGQISAQAVPTGTNNVGGQGCNNGVLGALSGVNSGIGFGGLGGLGVTGFGGIGGLGGVGGVGGLGGLNCVPAGPVIICQ